MGDLKARNWRELIKPKSILLEEDDHSEFYGKFVCERLERGFGITIGNALRRILLSSLQGAAIVSVKFDNVVHEFSSIPGVMEDVTEIILNLKELLHRTDPDVRCNAVQALARILQVKDARLIINLLDDIDINVKKASIKALGVIKSKRAIDPLHKFYYRNLE